MPARSFRLRTWSTPLTIGSFVLVAVTGVMMFFDIVPGYVVFAHQWLSWLFLIGCGGHIAVNWRPFLLHVRSGWGRSSVAVFLVLLVLSSFSFGRITAPQLKWPLANALLDAPLAAVAGVAGREPALLVEMLARHGVTAEPEQSIRHTAEAQGMDEFHVLGLVFLRD